jgi:hypothetical protein
MHLYCVSFVFIPKGIIHQKTAIFVAVGLKWVGKVWLLPTKRTFIYFVLSSSVHDIAVLKIFKEQFSSYEILDF